MNNRIYRQIGFLFTYYVLYGGNLIRYMRSKGAKIGNNCSFLGEISIFKSAEPYLIHIGNNVTIAQGVMLITHDGGTRVFRSTSNEWTSGTVKMGTINIEDNVFIGAGSIILQNINIGSNVVVGAGSVVTKDIPTNVVVAGVPAKVVCDINDYKSRSIRSSITIPEENIINREAYLTNYFWNE